MSTADFFELVDCIRTLMQFCHNRPAIFLRGVMVAGDYFHYGAGYIRSQPGAIVSHPMIYGTGLIEAYEFEKQLNLAACLITEKALHFAAGYNPHEFNQGWETCLANHHVIRYDIPCKTELLPDQYLINWVEESTHPTRDELEESFSHYNRPVDDLKVKSKINNTLGFYDHVKGLHTKS